MQQTFLSKVRYSVLLLLVLLVTFSCHPAVEQISRSAGIQQGSILSRYIIVVFGLLFLLCFNFKHSFNYKFNRNLWVNFLFVAIFYVLTLGFFGEKSMLGDLRSIIICLLAILIGYELTLDKKKIKILLLVYALLSLFVGFMQVMMNVGGFVILEQYKVESKNSIAVMISSASFIFMYLGCDNVKMRKVLLYGLTVLSFFVLLTIRARGATLTTIMMLLFLLFERYKNKDIFSYAVLFLFIIVIIFAFLPQSIKDYVYNSFFIDYSPGGDITKGRAERNQKALSIVSNHLLFGNMVAKESIGWIHNYPILKLFDYGLVFSMPILVLYFKLLLKVVQNSFKCDNKNLFNIGYYVLLIPFIVSMAEPTFPFGPGTATVVNFILFGISLKNTYIEMT